MLTNIRRAIEQYDLIAKNDTIIVALSGGADSVSLLFALKSLAKELCITLKACHVNHMLRGIESDNDEEFVRTLCINMEVPLTVKKVDVKAFQMKHKSIEETARAVRYQFFDELSSGNIKIATAHTLSDNAETVLINLVRGTAIKGLCGIPPVRGNIIRPLIFCTRTAVENFCGEHKLSFVTDKTNLSDDYTRNKIRHNVVPLLEEINPSFSTAVSRTAMALQEDNDFIEETVIQKMEEATMDTNVYDVEKLQSYPPNIVSRIILKIFKANGILPEFKSITEAARIIKLGGGKINVNSNKFVIVKKGTLTVAASTSKRVSHLILDKDSKK